MPSRARDAFLTLRAHLDHSLFREDPGPDSRLGRSQVAVLVVGFFVVAVGLQLLRLGIETSLDSLWAEDGPIFLQRALHEDLLTNLLTNYGGYLVVLPQLVAEFGSLFPLRDAPAAMALLDAFVTALSGLVVFVASRAYIRNPWLRGTLAALLVLSPVAATESVLDGSYLTWFTLPAVFWILLWRPRSTKAAAFGGAFALLTGLSNPGIWFFTPLAFLRACALRNRRDALILGGWTLAAVAQIPALILGPDDSGVTPVWTSDIWKAYLQRVLDGAVFGEWLGGHGWNRLGWLLLVALVVFLFVALFAGLRRADATARWIALCAVPISVLMFVVSVYQRAVASQMAWPKDIFFGAGGRYAIVPALLLVSVGLVMVDGAERRGARFGRWLALASIALLVVGIATSFGVAEKVARGTPPWGEALKTAGAQCRAEDLEAAPVAISPPGWGLVIDCDELPGGS